MSHLSSPEPGRRFLGGGPSTPSPFRRRCRLEDPQRRRRRPVERPPEASHPVGCPRESTCGCLLGFGSPILAVESILLILAIFSKTPLRRVLRKSIATVFGLKFRSEKIQEKIQKFWCAFILFVCILDTIFLEFS